MEFPNQIRAKIEIVKPATKIVLKEINPKVRTAALIETIRKENPHIKVIDMERINHEGETLSV